MKLDQLVEKYIELRDEKAALKKSYEASVADITQLMDKIEAVFLKKFNEEGSSSIKTPVGTAFKSTSVTASVADRDAFFKYVRENDAYEMLEARVNKTAVEQYRAIHEANPPGVNVTAEVKVSIRRS